MTHISPLFADADFRRIRPFLLTTGFFLAMMILTPGISQKSKQTKSAAPDSTLVTYNEHIFDLLDDHCLKCHSQGESNPSELFMDTYEGLMEGGKHGPPVVAGDPAQSILYQKVLPDPPFGKQMPAKTRKMLSEEEVDLLKLWILQGAAEKKSPPKEMQKR